LTGQAIKLKAKCDSLFCNLLRCHIPNLDLAINNSGMTNMSVLFDKAILSQYIPLNSERELDSCRRYAASAFDNRSSDDKMLEVGCNGHFVYDTSIYQQSRVYDVR
jgi:hypothetical protein